MTYAVRELELADIGAVQQIDATAHGQHWSAITLVDQVESADRHHLVVTQANAIVAHGALWFDGQQARITNVAVSSDQRRSGLGALVITHLCEAALAQPGAVRLSLEVSPTNLAAQSLYRKFGFAPVGIDRSFYGPGQDALVMCVEDLTDPSWQTRWADTSAPKATTAKGAVV